MGFFGMFFVNVQFLQGSTGTRRSGRGLASAPRAGDGRHLRRPGRELAMYVFFRKPSDEEIAASWVVPVAVTV